MLPKLVLAFLLGGTAVGVVVYLGMRNGAPPPPQPPVASAPVQPTVALPVQEIEPPPAVEAPAPPPALRKAKPARKPAPAAIPQAPAPVQTAKADPIPAPPPHVPVIAPPQLPAPEPVAEPQAEKKVEAPKPPPAPRQPKTLTIPAGSLLTVRLREGLSSEKNSADDSFMATLDAPLIVDGFVIAERGSLQRGRIVDLARAGRVKGRAVLAIELNQLSTADGQKVSIKTDTFRREAESSVKSDVAKAGVAAGIGAAIGAIAGGGKGAGIGAAIGGAAGAGGAMATRGQPADLPSETRVTFRLSEPVALTEKLN